MLVSLKRNSAKSEGKTVFIKAWLSELSPWCSALSSCPMAAAAESRSDIIVFMLEFLRHWQLSHGLLHMPALRADWTENRMWNLGPTQILLPYSCPVHFSCSKEQRATSAPVTQSREDEDATLCIRIIPAAQPNRLHFKSICGRICIFFLWCVLPIFTGKIYKETLFIILITKLFWITF